MKLYRLKWPLWLLLTLACTFFFAYQKWLSPTRVALINYRDFQVARFQKSNDSGWVELERIGKDQLDQLGEFDFVLIFGRGFALDQKALTVLKEQIADGVPILIQAATNPALDLTNIQQPHLDKIKQYLENSGGANYRNLLRYIRANIDQKSWGIELPLAVVDIDSDVLFHVDESYLFTDVEKYLDYYKTLPTYSSDGKKIALMTSVPGPFNANRDHLDALITSLEKRGYRVFPVASQTRRLELLKTISPDLVIMMPHGRLHLGQGADALKWLKQQQVPVLAPLSVFDDYEKWLNDPQGYSGSMLTMNVVLPELDGAVAPYVINAQYPDENGYLIFKTVPDRLESFLQLLDRFVALKSKSNKEKKIAIVYFRGPGKNALVAGGMEVAPSLFNSLHSLKREGYDLGDLPNNFEAFKEDLDRQGVVLAPFAKGDISRFLQNSNPELISKEVYQQWCKTLNKHLCEAMRKEYGPIPGEYMVTKDEQLAIARLQYGNVVVMPQPLAGVGEDTFALVHGTDKAPPYNYAGAYLWLRHVFNADAVMHYGTHGSLEFTPAKQVALSNKDWADALLSGLPHFYVYTMSNVGEAIIAKRRSYATIINHLTPPFQEAGLYSEWKQLADKVNEYSLSQGATKREIQGQIASLMEDHNVHQDLQLNTDQLREPENWDQLVLQPLSRWIETLNQEKITEGLYTLGRAYTADQAKNTAEMMTVDTLAESWRSVQQALDVDDLPASVTPQMREQAKRWIQRRLEGEDSKQILAEILPSNITPRVELWNKENPLIDDMAIIRGFIAMGKPRKNKANEHSDGSENERNLGLKKDALMALTIKVVADKEQRQFIESLKGEERFEHVSRSLDPEAAKTARVLAKVIPAIGKALAMLEKEDVRQLVEAMQHEPSRKKVIQWLEGNQLEELVAAAQEQRLTKRLNEAKSYLATVMPILLKEEFLHSDTAESGTSSTWLELQKTQNSLREFEQKFVSEALVFQRLAPHLNKKYQISAERFKEQLTERIAQVERALADAKTKEAQLAQSFKRLVSSLESIDGFVSHMLNAVKIEQQSALTAFAGGYIEPASGGDPIVNPLALPSGRNMYSIDAEKTPTTAAWKVGQRLADDLLSSYQKDHGRYPEKVSFTLWPNSFIQSQGATMAQVFYLLGVAPVHDAFGRVQTLRLIPAEELGRPRIDVVVQSAGQFRDIAASRLALFEKAVVMAANAAEREAESDALNDGVVNYVAKGVRDTERYLLEQGVSPLRARTLAATRSFGGVNGAYGTSIMGMVEGDSRWDNGDDIARQYLKNMGANYGSSEGWGDYEPHLFAAALLNTEVVIQPRSSNTWGALSLDHVYEFMGGLNNAVRLVTGKDPAAHFNDFRNPSRAQVSSFHETVWTEMRTTLLNPKFISSLQEGGSSSAETFAETFRNSFGWNVMKPEGMDETLWQSLYEVYVEDKHQLNLREFFEDKNPYALQEMLGVMLETSRRGYWQASEEQLKTLAELQAELILEFNVGGGDFSGGNPLLTAFTSQQLPQPLAEQLEQAVNTMRGETPGLTSKGVVLEKQNSLNNPAPTNDKQVDGANASSTVETKPPQPSTQPTNAASKINLSSWWVWLAVVLFITLAMLFFMLAYGRKQST